MVFIERTTTARLGRGAAPYAIEGEKVIGTDVGGGQYIGSITRNAQTDRFDLKLQLKAPPGVALVTDGRTRTASEVIPVEMSVTEADLGKPINLQMVTGPVTVTIHYLGESRDASAA